MKILIVDDEPDFRFLLKSILEEEGYQVAEASDGQEALQVLEEAQPDLLVVDWNMPRMNGTELCQAIRQKSPVHQVPIIMLTVRRQDRDMAEGLHQGADLYLAKPIEPKEVLLRIKTLLKK